MNSKHRINVLLLALPLVFLAACSTSSSQYHPPTDRPKPSPVAIHKMTTDEMIAEAGVAREPRQGQLYLYAASKLLPTNHQRARELLNLISPQHLSDASYSNIYYLLSAQAALLAGDFKESSDWLGNLNPEILASDERISYYSILASLDYQQGQYMGTIRALTKIVPQAGVDSALYDELWNSLQKISLEDLQSLQTNPPTREIQAWADLAAIYRTPEGLAHQQAGISRWKKKWTQSSAHKFMPKPLQALEKIKPYAPRRIAVMLPLSGPQAAVGSAVRDGLMTGYYHHAQKSGAKTTPELIFFDTEGQNPAILLQGIQAKGADLIVGPLRRSVATTALESRAKVKVPWLLLNQVSDNGFDTPIFQFGLASENESELAAQRAWADGYRNPLVLTADSEWGRRVAASYKKEWENLGGDIGKIYTFKNNGDYNSATGEALLVKSSTRRANILSNILGQQVEFTPRRRQDIDVIFVAGSPAQGRRLKPALDFYFAHDLPVYTVSNMYSGQPNPTQDRDLNNIRIPLMPWLTENSTAKTEIQKNWPKSKGPLAPLFALGLDIWRIYPSLPQMAHTPNAQVVGSTGILSVTANGEIKRDLLWHQFSHGRPAPLSQQASMNPDQNSQVLANVLAK